MKYFNSFINYFIPFERYGFVQKADYVIIKGTDGKDNFYFCAEYKNMKTCRQKVLAITLGMVNLR